MKSIKTLALSAVIALGAVGAHATTYTINSVINSSANGFGSSGFHGQTNGQMSGPFIDKFDASINPAGAWDTSITSGTNIYFSGELQAGGSVTARGLLNESTTRTNGVEGAISFTITGSSIAGLDGIYDMIFGDNTFVNSGGAVVANGIYGGNEIGLWGDLGNFVSKTACAAAGGFSCLGTDLRLGIQQGGTFNPPPVPLPASIGFLLLGLGGLAAVKRRKG